ncbi:MAG: transglycosylase SLT domain-containing protein, partial [Longimicrobiales bacterium]
MQRTRIIRAAVVSSRSLFFLDGAQPRGITYDALSTFEDFLNERLGSGVIRIHVVMIPLLRDQLLPALVEGRVDLAAANLTITPERLEVVDFSAPLLSDVSEVLVTDRLTPAPSGPEGLSGLEIHVRRSSSYFQSLQALNDQLRRAGRDPVLIREADELLEDEDLMELVNAGVIPATVVDNSIAQLWSPVFENVTVHPEVAVREGGEIGWAFRKGSPALKAVLADFARTHRQGTLQGNVALRRYLGTSEKMVNPLDREGEERLEEVLPVVEEYAVRYGFDPLLLLAQAFQESRLDQTAVSPVGAVGIMQLMPSTAADPNVGIPDVTSLENNVHAGAKYLRFLLDHYFSDAELDSLNEHLFAFAAYNAGAGRVAGLRAEAAELGLDPNR